jgi:hypothetical protein
MKKVLTVSEEEDIGHVRSLLFEYGRFVGNLYMCVHDDMAAHVFGCVEHVVATVQSTSDIIVVRDMFRGCADGLSNFRSLHHKKQQSTTDRLW